MQGPFGPKLYPGLSHQQPKGQCRHYGLGNEAGPGRTFQVHGRDNPIYSVNQNEVEDNIETGTRNGDQHGPNRVLKPLENPNDGKYEEGQRESPNPDTVIGNTVVEDSAGGVQELKDLLAERERNKQDQYADPDIEGNGLCRQGGDVF